MIRDDHELHGTQEQVVRFENALLSLRHQTFEKDPQGFRRLYRRDRDPSCEH
jgi:hypothetical protein